VISLVFTPAKAQSQRSTAESHWCIHLRTPCNSWTTWKNNEGKILVKGMFIPLPFYWDSKIKTRTLHYLFSRSPQGEESNIILTTWSDAFRKLFMRSSCLRTSAFLTWMLQSHRITESLRSEKTSESIKSTHHHHAC